jgi:hypothetical protein
LDLRLQRRSWRGSGISPPEAFVQQHFVSQLDSARACRPET